MNKPALHAGKRSSDGRLLRYVAAGFLLFTLTGAQAQEATVDTISRSSSEYEIRQFCTNIADAARDRRYLLQKQELEKLQTDVDERIAPLGF